MRKVPMMSLLLSWTFASSLLADQVTLKNGDRFSGAIIKSDAKTLTLKSEFAGDIEIQWDAVQQITSGEPVYLIYKNGKVASGQVTTEDGNFAVQPKTGPSVRVPKADVTALRNQEQQAAYEKLQHPSLTQLWYGAVNTGIALSRGNSRTFNFAVGIQADRETPKDKIDVSVASLYASNSTTGTKVTTANQIGAGIRYEHSLRDPWFAFAQLGYLRNPLQFLNLQLTPVAGLGYHAIKSDRTTLDLLGGLGFNQQYFAFAPSNSSGEFMLGDALNVKLTKALAFTQGFQFFPSFTNGGQYHFNGSATLTAQLTKVLSWQLNYTDAYLSNPPHGARPNDTILTTGLQLSFGHKPSP